MLVIWEQLFEERWHLHYRKHEDLQIAQSFADGLRFNPFTRNVYVEEQD